MEPSVLRQHRPGHQSRSSDKRRNVAAFDRVAEDQGVTAPGVVGAAAIRLKGAAEIGSREQRYAIGNAELLGRLIKRVHALAELGEQIILRAQFVAMRVVTAN